MGEAKRRREAIARGEGDLGPFGLRGVGRVREQLVTRLGPTEIHRRMREKLLREAGKQ